MLWTIVIYLIVITTFTYVIHGATPRTTIDLSVFKSGQSGFVVKGANYDDTLGYSVSNIGDVNGDNIDDILLGAYHNNVYAGISYVLFGKVSQNYFNIDLSAFKASSKLGFAIFGAQELDCSGYTVSNTGDINNDGIHDFVIGAANANYNNRAYSGISYVIFGQRSFSGNIDLAQFSSGSKGFIIGGANAGDLSSGGLSYAGDFNGDGYDDLIVGSYLANTNKLVDNGLTYVIFGSKNSQFNTIDLASYTGFTAYGAASGDYSGQAVGGGGDVNGDSIDDIIIGASHANPYGRKNAGITYIIFGSISVTTQKLDLSKFKTGNQGFRVLGRYAEDYCGSAVSYGGDINNDGYGDILIGAPQAGNNQAGAVYVIFGHGYSINDIDLSVFTSGALGFVIYGAESGDALGVSVKYAGDINGDSIADFIVGAYQASPYYRKKAGSAYVFYGRDSYNTKSIDLRTYQFTSTTGFMIIGANTGDNTGGSVSSAGDVNGDGISDILLGAERASPNDIPSAGMVYIIFGYSTVSSSIPTMKPTSSMSLLPSLYDGLANIFNNTYTTHPTSVVPSRSPSSRASIHRTLVPTLSHPTHSPTESINNDSKLNTMKLLFLLLVLSLIPFLYYFGPYYKTYVREYCSMGNPQGRGSRRERTIVPTSSNNSSTEMITSTTSRTYAVIASRYDIEHLPSAPIVNISTDFIITDAVLSPENMEEGKIMDE